MATLPKNERRTQSAPTRRTMWIYGSPFSGKTTFADHAPNPLMLNTDGNAEYVTAPYVSIQDEVTTIGRMTKRKLAWEVFKEYLGVVFRNFPRSLVLFFCGNCHLIFAVVAIRHKMTYVGDIHNALNVVANVAKILFKHVLHSVGTEISYMSKVINRRSAGVDRNLARFSGNEFISFSCKRIV